MPAAGSEGVPKIRKMKMSPNAILNSTSLPKGTLKSIEETPSSLSLGTILCLELEVRVGAKNS